jgi:hypothetical protein
MIKQNFNLSEEESKRILKLHQDATKNHYILSEQLVSIEKNKDINLFYSTKDPKTQRQYINYKLIDLERRAYLYRARTREEIKKYGAAGAIKEDESKDYYKLVESMVSRMDPDSKDAFNKLSQSSDENLRKFYFHVLKRFQLDFQSERGVKDKKIVVDNVETIEKQLVKKGTEPVTNEVIEPGYILSTIDGVKTSNFFVDNEATLTPEFRTFVNEHIVAALQRAKEALQDKGGLNTGKLINMVVESSCSKLKNGPSRTVQNDGKDCAIDPRTKKPYAACPTFMTLSKARAEAARNYVLNELKRNSIDFSKGEISINSNGQNGDGTSGPEWSGNMADKQSYDQYKYTKINLQFVIDTKKESKSVTTTPGSPDEYEPKTVNDYIIRFTATGRKKLHIEIPSFRFELPTIRIGRLMSVTPKFARCPKW